MFTIKHKAYESIKRFKVRLIAIYNRQNYSRLILYRIINYVKYIKEKKIPTLKERDQVYQSQNDKTQMVGLRKLERIENMEMYLDTDLFVAS